MIQLELLLPDASPNNVVIRLEVFRAFKRDESPSKTPDWHLSIAKRLRPYLKGPYDSREILQLIHSFMQRNRIKGAAREVLAAGEHEAWEYTRDEAGKLAWRVLDIAAPRDSEKEARRATIPKSCLCRRDGWVWAYELPGHSYDGEADDTHYDCPECREREESTK